MAGPSRGGPLRPPAKAGGRRQRSASLTTRSAAPTGFSSTLSGKHILLGVSGGIAAYKVPELVRLLIKAGSSVRVIMTRNAHHFVTETTLCTVSEQPVVTDMFAAPANQQIDHVAFAAEADAYLVAPATANVIAKFASGIADDMVSTTFLSCRCPVVIAPAMHEAMWENPATVANVDSLRSRGVIIVEPEVGELASGDTGKGRLASLETIVAALGEALSRGKDLSGVRLLVTAGPTREPLDAVRFITNKSSGKMGYAIAERALERGAEVYLVSGPTNLPVPRAAHFVSVETAEQMLQKAEETFPTCHALVAAAAVCDFRPAAPFTGKRDKSEEAPVLSLERTPDVLASLSSKKQRQITIGFAAEFGDSPSRAKRKLLEKNLDLIVLNDISRQDIGFESDSNEVILLPSHGSPVHLPRSSKTQIADAILDRLAQLLGENDLP